MSPSGPAESTPSEELAHRDGDASRPGSDLEGRTPAHQRVVDDLLAWGRPRPSFDPDLAEMLEARLETGLAEVGRLVDERIWLSKSGLRALDCDGRWLDQQSATFTPSVALVAGTLSHRAAELDTNAARRVPLDAVLDQAEQELSSNPTSREADLLNGLDQLGRADLRATCRGRVVEWRALWPLLDRVDVTFEHRLRGRFADGAVVVSGRPDLVVQSPHPRAGQATDVILDLKTGRRNDVADRADLRLYALLWTLKFRRPPFRWATFYLAEGRWDAEDLAPALLIGAADRVIDGARRVARLRAGVPEEELVLRPGAHCTFCGRRDTCPVAPPRP